MKLQKTTLATAIAAALTMGAAGQASASVYAHSSLDVQNLVIFVTEAFGTTNAPSPNATTTSFLFTTTNTASLNGSGSVSNSATCGGIPIDNNCNIASPRLDALAVNAPGSTVIRGNNDFSYFGPGADQYSNADSVIVTAELAGDPTTLTRQIAEAELQTGFQAASNAEIQSSTGFSFSFVVNGGLNNALVLAFQADASLAAIINQGSAFQLGNAQANLNVNFALTRDSDGAQVSWSPQGSSSNNCDVDDLLTGFTCNETADGTASFNGFLIGQAPTVGGDLNRTVSVSSNPASSIYSDGVGMLWYGLVVRGLDNGAYTASANFLTSTQLSQTYVPEPGILALLGIGLAGLGFMGRRRKV